MVAQKNAKNYSTQYSRVVPHHSTDWAITSLTSEIRRDPVLSGVYGRSYFELASYRENLSSHSSGQNGNGLLQVQTSSGTKAENGERVCLHLFWSARSCIPKQLALVPV